jgi:outer membrane protein assembly factor BamE (lipoprotein component of BamABCDE complex)
MTRRRILCGLLLASAVLACGVSVLLIANARKMTRAKFEQVQVGMSRAEVIRTVGGPPGDYSNGGSLYYTVYLDLQTTDYQHWLSDDGHLAVYFDDANTATNVVVCDVPDFGPPTFTERLRRWLGL